MSQRFRRDIILASCSVALLFSGSAIIAAGAMPLPSDGMPPISSTASMMKSKAEPEVLPQCSLESRVEDGKVVSLWTITAAKGGRHATVISAYRSWHPNDKPMASFKIEGLPLQDTTLPAFDTFDLADGERRQVRIELPYNEDLRLGVALHRLDPTPDPSRVLVEWLCSSNILEDGTLVAAE